MQIAVTSAQGNTFNLPEAVVRDNNNNIVIGGMCAFSIRQPLHDFTVKQLISYAH